MIGSALVAGGGGEGHRRIGVRLGLPVATVRGWLRRFRSRASVIAVFFTQWALAFSVALDPPGPSGSAAGDAVEAIGMATRSAVMRFGPGPAWSTVSRLTGGELLSNNRRGGTLPTRNSTVERVPGYRDSEVPAAASEKGGEGRWLRLTR